MSTRDPRTPRRELVHRLVETARLVRNHVEQVARAHGTTRAQWGLLARLDRLKDPSQIDLARDMELTPIALARLVDRTEQAGLIERRPDARDRRVNRLALTERGRDCLVALDPVREAVAAGLLHGVAPERVAIALEVLGEVAARLQGDAARPARTGASDGVEVPSA